MQGASVQGTLSGKRMTASDVWKGLCHVWQSLAMHVPWSARGSLGHCSQRAVGKAWHAVPVLEGVRVEP